MPLPSPASRPRVGLPGLLFLLFTAVAIVIALDSNSRSSFTGFLLTALVWFVLAAAWLARFAAAMIETGGRMPATDWLRWLAIPFALAIVFLITRTDVVRDARLALSRGAMDAMAVDVMAGGSTERGWVGLYGVGEVERTSNGLRFVVDSGIFRRFGFAYAPDGEPEFSDDNYSPLWTGATFESIGGGWWIWTETWD